MREILLFGAGKSATVLIDYFLENAPEENWHLTVVDANLMLAESKLHNSSFGKAVSFDVADEIRRQYYIEHSSIVISLLPPHLHILVAQDCILLKKDLLTASYADKAMKKLRHEVLENDLLFLCEMGLDPGLDHISAKK